MMKYRKIMTAPALLLVLLLSAGTAWAGPDDGSVGAATKLVDNGDDGARFDIVLLAEGYTSEQLETFAVHAQAFSDYLFETPPFSTS